MELEMEMETEIEITLALDLSPAEAGRLELHSFLNILNLAVAELHAVGALAPEVDGWRQLRTRLDSLRQALDESHFSPTVALLLLETGHQLETAITDSIGRNQQLIKNAEFCALVLNLRSIIATLKARTHEFESRRPTPSIWVAYSTWALNDQLRSFFEAVTRNSKGRYRIAAPGEFRDANTYLIDIDIRGKDQDRIQLPPPIHDVFRDLLANARKYTPPGGTIKGVLEEKPDCLELTVEDTGRGIPTDEIQKVFQFGYRASNAQDVRTYGGGFGLTKAYMITKRLGGRLWVRSAPGHGTRFRIWIPHPPTAAARRTPEPAAIPVAPPTPPPNTAA